ncbi:MAG: 50S ribosomal protein L23 [Microgenomates group bacterium]
MSLKDILLKPIITEKSTRAVGEGNKYTFWVARNASKNQIRKAVEKFWGVKVLGVNTIRVSGKTRRSLKTRKEFKGAEGKKAVVKLAEGQKIDVFEFPAEEKEKK